VTASGLLDGVRVTVVHSYYRESSISGENLAVDMQIAALEAAGATVDIVARSTDTLRNRRFYTAESWARVASERDLGGAVLPPSENDKHILLVHNLFPNFGIDRVINWQGPLVAVMHNFRTFCANGLLLRNGKFCDKCIGGNSIGAVQHGCYRGSRVASVPLAITTRGGARRNPLLTRADRVICQSTRAETLFVESGADVSKISMIPGFTPEPITEPDISAKSDRWVFVGRLSPEKGLLSLVKEWPIDVKLDVIGDGEEWPSILDSMPDSIELLGRKQHEEVLASLGSYRGLIYPGVCSEGAYPMVVREALARGVPVLAAEGSSAADLIDSRGGGLVYHPGKSELSPKLNQIEFNQDDYSLQARSVFTEVLAENIWITKMMAAFDSAHQHWRST
jgi:glycosyltransferase involved in cell wall biosynthesis